LRDLRFSQKADEEFFRSDLHPLCRPDSRTAYLEDGGSMLLLNTIKYLSIDTTSYPRRLEFRPLVFQGLCVLEVTGDVTEQVSLCFM
jgi:hypothetical protein